jgi:hypothetical protein
LDSLALGVPCIMTSHSYTPSLPGLVFCNPDEATIREAIDRVGRARPDVQTPTPVDDLEVARTVLRIVAQHGAE